MSLKKQLDLMIFEAIKYVALKVNNMEIRSEQVIKKIHEALGLIPPDVPRTEDLTEKVEFVKEKNRLVVSLYSGFNSVKGEFPKDGALQIVISQPGESYDSERVFTRQFARRKGVEKIVEDYLEYIFEEISEEKRPLTKNKNWASILEVTQDEFFWVDEEQNIIRPFFENVQKGSLVEKNQKQRLYYDVYTRVKKGYKKRRREIKKQYKKKY
jgi:hypothetical protein